MSNILMQTYTIALPIVLTSLMGYIIWVLKEQKKDRDANSRGTMVLLREHLIRYHNMYANADEVPVCVYENFMSMYEAYNGLGGNGVVTKMKEEMEELHFKKKNK